MSEEAVLIDGQNRKAYRKSNFDVVNYNFFGSVTSFKVKGDAHTYVRTVRTVNLVDSYFGFLEEINFGAQRERVAKGAKVTDPEWRKGEFTGFDKLEPAQNGDIVKGAYPVFTTDGRCKQLYKFTYNGTIPTSYNTAANIDGLPFACNNFGGNTTLAGSFFNTYKNVNLSNPDGSPASPDLKLIGSISALLERAGEETAQAFVNFLIDHQRFAQFSIINIDGVTDRTYFEVYKKSLEKWLQMLKDYKEEIRKLDSDQKLFIYLGVMYRYNILEALTVEEKIKLLRIASSGSLISWYFAGWDEGFQDRELLALRIVESVTAAQSSAFLSALISVKEYGKDDRTLYKALFHKFDDYGGSDRFTAYIKKLEQLVLASHNIPVPPTSYTLQQLQSQVTTKHFIWRGKERKKGRVTYSIIQETNTTITFEEKIWVETALEELVTTTSAGIPSFTGVYIEKPTEIEETPITAGHFDLVTIHFFDNPSFVDTSSEPTLITGVPYITFAGFVAYILEKEDTEFVESLFEAGLYAISLSIGFGEFIAAVRTINAARAVLGAIMVSSETAVFLSTNTPFRNYIVENYPQDYERILSNLQFIGILGSLGTGTIQGAGILKVLSKAEALEFVGTTKAIMLDDGAAALLATGEKGTAAEAVARVVNELSPVINELESIEAIAEAAGSVRLVKYPQLQTAVNALSALLRNKFYQAFALLPEEILEIVNSIFVGSNAVARAEILANSDLVLKYIKARQLLINSEYNQIARLFNKAIEDGVIHQGYRYVVDGPFIPADLTQAIQIANNSADVSAISTRLNIPQNIIQRVKQHFYIDEHLILTDSGKLQIGRFERISSDNIEWLRMANDPLNTITANEILSFKRFIAHEYIEAKLMEKGLSFRALDNHLNATPFEFGAHDIAPIISSGNYNSLGRISSPPLPNYTSLNNLDEIVTWYTDFYKL